jgi:amino acid transporter
MAPTAAIALNGVVPAQVVGRAVPLVFAAALVGAACIAYGFVRLSRHVAHAGSAYALAGATLGPRAGFLAGWAMLGAYVALAVASVAEVGLFTGEALRHAGTDVEVDWLVPALAAGALVAALALRRVQVAARVLLALEAVSLTIVIALLAAIAVILAGGDAPRGQGFTVDAFTLPDGVGGSELALASVFAFLSFVGFEGAAALGEEALRPHRTIPLALAAAVGATGVLFLAAMTVQTLAFGTDAAGVRAFAGAGSPLAELGELYANAGVAVAIDVGAGVSGFAAGLAGASAAARLAFALARDGARRSPVAAPSPRTGVPAAALVLVLAVVAASLAAMRAAGLAPIEAFFYPATAGALALLPAYALTAAGAIRFLGARGSRAGLVVPAVGIAYLGYVLVKSVDPLPPGPLTSAPLVAGGWLALGVLITALVPGLAARIGAGLAGAVRFGGAAGRVDDG